jgi:hypothetical protein
MDNGTVELHADEALGPDDDEEEEEHAEPKRPRDTDNKRKRSPTDVDRSLVSTKKQAVAIDREVVSGHSRALNRTAV